MLLCVLNEMKYETYNTNDSRCHLKKKTDNDLSAKVKNYRYLKVVNFKPCTYIF